MNIFNSAIKKEIPTVDLAPNVLSFLNNLVDAYKENKKNEVSIEAIRAKREVLIYEMEQKYTIIRDVFDRIFEERHTAIMKSFEVIDQGMANNDKELIMAGMSGLSRIVSSSPFADLKTLSNMLERNEIIEI